MSKKKRKKGKFSGERDRPTGRWPFDIPPLELLPEQEAGSVNPAEKRKPHPDSTPPVPISSEETSLALRFIDTLERQLQAKDEQLRQMDARLQDSFDMQRALALIVRQFEQRTGISSDVVWDQVPEEELERQQHDEAQNSESERSDEAATSSRSNPENVIWQEASDRNGQKRGEPEPHQAQATNDSKSRSNEARSFDEWLGDLA